jgi:hypothetical protein
MKEEQMMILTLLDKLNLEQVFVHKHHIQHQQDGVHLKLSLLKTVQLITQTPTITHTC